MIARAFLTASLCLAISGVASAQATNPYRDDRPGDRYGTPRHYDDGSRWSARVGLGFTLDPKTFLTGIELPYDVNGSWSLGPSVQVGVDDRETLVAATLHSRYFLDLRQLGIRDARQGGLRPFVQGGIGLVHLDQDRSRKQTDRDETSFLFNVGMGVDYRLTDILSVGSHMLFNVVPADVLDENFYFSWHLVTAQIRF